MTPTLESIAEQGARRANAYADSLPVLLPLPPVMSKEQLAEMLADRREDALNDARDILAEQKRTRGDED